jgi:hypothetical protein
MTSSQPTAATREVADFIAISRQIELLLTARNLRGMQQVQQQLRPGYILRAARLFNLPAGSTILIGTGFPVLDTFETDGPVGAIALYQAALALNLKPYLVCGKPLFSVLAQHYQCVELPVNQLQDRVAQARQLLQQLKPALVLSIERPGLSAAGTYVNMRGEDISTRCASFDELLNLAPCPTLAIGDGGNEIGMGNVQTALASLNITPSITECDELVVADVSNWAAWGMIAMLSVLQGRNLLANANLLPLLQFLTANGCIDGVTRQRTLTEDGLPYQAGEQLIQQLQMLVQPYIVEPDTTAPGAQPTANPTSDTRAL